MTALEAQCRTGKSVFMRTTGGAEHRMVRHEKTVLIAVYKDERILTFLPRQARRTSRLRRTVRGLLAKKASLGNT